MKYKKLAAAILSSIALLALTACADVAKEAEGTEAPAAEKDAASEYEEIAAKINRTKNPVPLELSEYSRTTGTELSFPLYQSFAVNEKMTIKGKIAHHDKLSGKFAWIKIKQDGNDADESTFEYYSPIDKGVLEQTVRFYNGEGTYTVQIMLPSTERENYYVEVVHFSVQNVNPRRARDIAYTPAALESGLKLNKPSAGFSKYSGTVPIEGELGEPGKLENIMLQIKKGKETWQHVIPVIDSHFSYELPLFFGKGVHEINVLVPDEQEPNLYQHAAAFLADNLLDKRTEPILYHKDYEARGIELIEPKFGGEKTDRSYPISGRINPDAEYAGETTHLYVKTKKGKDEALDIIPVKNYKFDDEILLRFGPGEYEVTVNVPEINPDPAPFFSFYSVAAFKVENTDKGDERDLLPSRGIESEDPEIIALAHTLTKNSRGDREKAKAIYEYTAKNITYDTEKYRTDLFEWDDSALKTLKKGSGVCQDYAYLAAALLRASGIEARYIAGDAGNGPDKENHAWIEAKIGGEWITMDPTWGAGYVKDGTFFARYTDDYFDPDPESFRETHIRKNIEY